MNLKEKSCEEEVQRSLTKIRSKEKITRKKKDAAASSLVIITYGIHVRLIFRYLKKLIQSQKRLCQAKAAKNGVCPRLTLT